MTRLKVWRVKIRRAGWKWTIARDLEDVLYRWIRRMGEGSFLSIHTLRSWQSGIKGTMVEQVTQGLSGQWK